MRTKKLTSQYFQLRSNGWCADNALRAAKTIVRFEQLAKQDLVKIEAEPDNDCALLF
jgi:hypothetical protein